VSRPPKRRFSPEEDAYLGAAAFALREDVRKNQRLRDLYAALIELGEGKAFTVYSAHAAKIARREKRRHESALFWAELRFRIADRVAKQRAAGKRLTDNASGEPGVYAVVADELGVSETTVRRYSEQALFHAFTAPIGRPRRDRATGAPISKAKKRT
jgi:hypothetical protein